MEHRFLNVKLGDTYGNQWALEYSVSKM